MNRPIPHALQRAALRTLAAGLTGVMVCTATTGYTLAPQTTFENTQAARQLTIPVALTGAIDDQPMTLGIADSNLYSLSDAEIETTLDKLKAMGVNDIRIAVPWIYIEKQNGVYDWTKLDYVVEQANEREMNIVGVISATPTWAGFPLNGHSDPAEYGAFAGEVANRYEGQIAAYEIWNEPNGALFYNPVSASSYTKMLIAANAAIKAEDEKAVVIAGVLGSVITVPFLTQNPETFVQQMYAAGAEGNFDAISFHPYHYTLPFSLGAGVANSPINQVAAIRALMNANDDEDLKIWVTEYGLPTTNGVSEAQQAAFIHDFVVKWQSIDGAGPIFIYTTQDTATGSGEDEENFGIFHTDWTPKEAAATIEALIEDLEDGVAEPFDVTPYVPNVTVLDQVLTLARQLSYLVLLVPRYVVQVVTSIVTAIVQTIATGVGSLFGRNTPALARTSGTDQIAALTTTSLSDEEPAGSPPPASTADVKATELKASPLAKLRALLHRPVKEVVENDAQEVTAAAEQSPAPAVAPASAAVDDSAVKVDMDTTPNEITTPAEPAPDKSGRREHRWRPGDLVRKWADRVERASRRVKDTATADSASGGDQGEPSGALSQRKPGGTAGFGKHRPSRQERNAAREAASQHAGAAKEPAKNQAKDPASA